ncbi:MAG TPA: choice-of-anchor D domain-containing protein [Terriglobales bacterium]
MKRIGPVSTCAACALVVFLFAAPAVGQLAVTPSPVNFGSVPLGSRVSQSASLSNTGNSSLTISQGTVSGTGFSFSGLSAPLTLAPGQAVSVTTTFAPQSSGSASGTLSLTYSVQKTELHGKSSPSSTSTTKTSLSGTGTPSVQLAANPTSLNFASVQVGSKQTQFATLTNSGGSGLTISQATVTGAGFSITGLNLPLTLNAGKSVTFSVVFAPQTSGSASGSITIGSNASNPTLTISLSGTATAPGQLALTPTALNFGSVTVGSNLSQASSLSASGASVTVSSAGLSSAEFTLTGISFPLAIGAGKSVPFTLTFAPQTSGTASGTLSFASNASNVPTETLSGTGLAPTQHSVSLSWTDSGSAIVGYNVYRGSGSGGPYAKINSALGSTTAYTDTSVLAGQTYYYVTTSVEGSGMESGYSNEAQAVIPSP